MREKYKLDTSTFIGRSNVVHKNKYSYDKTVYKNQRTKVIITCPIHGDFLQTPKNHMNGQGCPICGKDYARSYHKGKYSDFIKESEKRFGEKYSFPNIESEYVNSHSKITIRCNTCGNTFKKIACDHLTSSNGGCHHCYFTKSKPEQELGEFIKNLLGKDQVSFNNRSILKNNEIDIYIPSVKIGIEFNGLYWHSFKDKYYHVNKTDECNSLGVKLIQIFEDEFITKKEIVLSKIRHLLKKDYNLEKIYARKSLVKEISYKDAKSFLDKNHIQGSSKSTIYLGGFINNNLISVMSFKRESIIGKWELTRFATDIRYICIGFGGKLFSYFVKNYNPEEVKSFADRRWTINPDNNLYTKLGFKLEKTLKPDYKYFINGCKERIHKFNFRKKTLHNKYGLPLTMTESEMANEIGARKIYDCGLLKYLWRK